MPEHVCDWIIGLSMPDSATAKLVVRCRVLGCGMFMSRKEAETRLNEYDKLKKATDALSEEHARQLVIVAPLEGMKAFDSLKAYADARKGIEPNV